MQGDALDQVSQGYVEILGQTLKDFQTNPCMRVDEPIVVRPIRFS